MPRQVAATRLAVVLGAFVGLRLAEACGLRVEDVDFLQLTSLRLQVREMRVTRAEK